MFIYLGIFLYNIFTINNSILVSIYKDKQIYSKTNKAGANI
jgi:hypothetical protein